MIYLPLVLPSLYRRDFAVTFNRHLPTCALYLPPSPTIERSHHRFVFHYLLRENLTSGGFNLAIIFPFALYTSAS